MPSFLSVLNLRIAERWYVKSIYTNQTAHITNLFFASRSLLLATAKPWFKLLLCGFIGLSLPTSLHAFNLEADSNPYLVIKRPTALDQPSEHSVHFSFEMTDIGLPKMRVETARYSFQWNALQWLNEGFYTVEPKHKFDHFQSMLKLRFFDVEEYRISAAAGILGRRVERREEKKQRIEDRSTSLLLVITIEVFPWETQWGGLLVNTYLDNLVATVGFKIQIWHSIKAVMEIERFHHNDERKDRNRHRGGVDFGGVGPFYFQLFAANAGKGAFLQTGVLF